MYLTPSEFAKIENAYLDEQADAGQWAAQEPIDVPKRIENLERKLADLRAFRETCIDKGLRRNVIAAEQLIAWLEHELADLRTVRDAETCAVCNGSGERSIGGYDADNPPDYISCDVCGGTGQISGAQERDAFDGVEEAE